MLATLMLVYAAVQLVGQALYGVDRWVARGDAFGVYFAFFARLSPLVVRDHALVLRRPLSSLARIDWQPGTIALLCAAIGITAFDGAAEGPVFNSFRPELQDAFTSGPTQQAVRSQYWMLAVMVGFTSLGLWLLSESNG